MPYKILTEIDKPPSFYGRITKGTFLEPWIIPAYERMFYFNAPFNIWEEHSSMFERITRAGHLGFFYGGLQGLVQGYFSNLAKGYRGHEQFKNKHVWKVGGFGMVNGLLASTVFAVTVSQMSSLNHRPEKAIDFYFGGVAAGITTIGISQIKGAYYSKRWNMVALMVLPLFPAAAKYLMVVNEYDDVKGGRYPMAAGGQQLHSAAEMRGLYGIEPHEVPLEKILKKPYENDMLFMKPRQNPRWNDKYREEESE